jgi:hypothetical protein
MKRYQWHVACALQREPVFRQSHSCRAHYNNSQAVVLVSNLAPCLTNPTQPCRDD